MKLICEDMRGILVQITKGNLENEKLSLDDLYIKLDETIDKLKKEYKMEFDNAEESVEMKDPNLVGCHLPNFQGEGNPFK